jgi:glyceraldehyde-3-phosphate dehydrogenase (NADP+)
MQSGKIDCLAFIGSGKVCRYDYQQHPTPHKLRAILGLGAKNPAIIFPDANIDVA